MQPKVSIIIPLHVISTRFFNDLSKFKLLKYNNFEIIIVSDRKVDLGYIKGLNITHISTGKKLTGPAEKRDLALKNAKGEICAFIDDDAYPDKNWLNNALVWFKNPDIVAVGGPGLTPKEDSFSEKIGGYILESYLCSGSLQSRYYKKSLNPQKDNFFLMPNFVVDWPAYNLIVRKSVLKKVAGFKSTFYGGEDTALCLKLIKYGRILADPNIVVYHHRRKFPLESLKQIANVGLHRGYFFKKFPETSRSIVYLLPAFLTGGFLLGTILTMMYPEIFLIPFFITFISLLALGVYSVYIHKVGFLGSLLAGLGIMLTHITYAVFFVKGLFTKNLNR